MTKPPQLQPYTVQVGPHRLEYEPPDVVHVHYVGEVELEHFKVVDEALRRIQAPLRAYLLRDGRQGGAMSAETRAYMAKHIDPSTIAATITYGSSFHTRTVMQMLNKAMVLLHDKHTNALFLDTEEEARAWIDEHRKTSAAKGTVEGKR